MHASEADCAIPRLGIVADDVGATSCDGSLSYFLTYLVVVVVSPILDSALGRGYLFCRFHVVRIRPAV